ncbi:hypothetical protein Pmani_035095 [Petrolisthes manimaculis]|uniref:Alpha-macroglobulin receptor-binding domain-containing protein n=1 Tax=Petrolisthes manimaculis TaxID=1843537 RepID=A0AAE1TNI8_9EUCA|nr:hypothetical protein Pmani_035095 [Petrolisthes manimaculis]
MKRVEGNKIYWSREAIEFNPLIYEDSQKPFIQPQRRQKWDAHSVETTSYALLVYMAREAESSTSGVAVVEVHLPSGYTVMQDSLIELVNTRTVRNLRWALCTHTQVKFFLNHLDTREVCLSYNLERWYAVAVANHSRYNMARYMTSINLSVLT